MGFEPVLFAECSHEIRGGQVAAVGADRSRSRRSSGRSWRRWPLGTRSERVERPSWGCSFWAIGQASGSSCRPDSDERFRRKRSCGPVGGRCRCRIRTLGASFPLISQVPMAPTGRAKRKSAPAVDDPDRARASSPKRWSTPDWPEEKSDRPLEEIQSPSAMADLPIRSAIDREEDGSVVRDLVGELDVRIERDHVEELGL
jgi:hypothetical protein